MSKIKEKAPIFDQDEAQDDIDGAHGTPYSISSILRRLRFRAHWLAPNLIPNSLKDHVALRLEREYDEGSRISEEIELRARAIWGVEVFGPNESQQLYTALKRLRWAQQFAEEGDDALAWVQKQRSYFTGGWFDLGVVTRIGQQKKFVGITSQAEMPEGVKHALVRLHQICPTITCIVVCFVLDNKFEKCYEENLNRKRTGYYKRGKLGWVRRIGPYEIKQEDIHNQRIKLRQSVSNWFSRTIPGYFTNSGAAHSLPFAELLCTAGDDVFTEHQGPVYSNWRRILTSPWEYEIWKSQGSTPLRFVDGQFHWPKELRNFLVAGLSISSLPEELRERNIVHLCDEELTSVLPYFAILGYLKEISRELKLTREELHVKKSRSRTLRSITRIQQYFDRNAGVPPAVREICKSVERPGSLDRYVSKFTAPKFGETAPVRYFAEELREHLHQTAMTLLEDESSAREHFEQLASILSIKESISAQRWMGLLTLVALVVAGLSLAAAWPDRWDTKIRSINEKAQILLEEIQSQDMRDTTGQTTEADES